MNFNTLVSSVVVSLALSASAFAQWGGSSLNMGIGGSYNRTTLPNGRSITSNNLSWGVGLGSASYNYPAYGGWGGYGGGGCTPAVLPYYGGGCTPAVLPYYGGRCYPVVSYSPFTNTWGNPRYAPQYPCVPAAYLPQASVGVGGW